MRDNTITLLGTGTCQLQRERMASSVLIEWEGIRVEFDMGRGVTQRLTERGYSHDDIQHIVFSHFHPDHMSDCIPFIGAGLWSRIDPRSKPLHLYGPKGFKREIHRYLLLAGKSKEYIENKFPLYIHEITEKIITIDEHQFDFCELPPSGNHGIRFSHKGKIYACTGDSYFHDQEVSFLADAHIGIIDAGDISNEEILALAIQTSAHTIVCSHLYREIDQELLNEEAQKRGYAGTIIVGEDLMVFPIE